MGSKVVICVLLIALLGCTLAKPKPSKGKGKGIHTKAVHTKPKKAYKTKPIPEVLPPARPCDGVSCGIGRECIVTEEQEPTCQCLETCPPHDHQVCGSDGVTYPNKCELHRASCVQETKITQVKKGPCDVAPTVVQTRERPVVCYQTDRDVLQQQLVQWLQGKEMDDGWFLSGKRYLDVVDEYFQLFDETGDEVLDPSEFMNFVEHNETVRNSTSQDENTEEDNQLMRSMCVDALLAEADEDFDWRLNLKEFEKCLRLDFQTDTKMCSLEGQEYADGEEMQNRCNECVCACGNWVCTANACDGDMIAGTEAQEEYDPAEENAMNQKEWKAIMKKLAKVAPDQFPDHVRDLKHLEERINAPHVPETLDDLIAEEDFEELEQVVEEVALEVEKEAKQVDPQQVDPQQVDPQQVDPQAPPVVPAQVEVAVPDQVEEQPRERDMGRIRTGKKAGKGRGTRKGTRHGKKSHKAGGMGKN